MLAWDFTLGAARISRNLVKSSVNEKKLANLITRQRYRRANAPLPAPAAHSFILRLSSSSSFLPSHFSQPSYPRVLRQIVSLPSLPTQIINRRDLCRFLESGPERKGEKTQPSSFASSRHIRHPRFFCGTPLGYRGWPINRAHGYKMNIGEHARYVQQWNACLRI